MKIHHRLVVLALLAASTLVLTEAQPASAAVTVAVSGTTLTATATGDATIEFYCNANVVNVNFVPTSPAIPCTTFTKATVNGDGGSQAVYGNALDDFPAHPTLTVALGGGSDSVLATRQADNLNLGAGNDYAYLPAGGTPDASVQMGADQDWAEFWGTQANDQFSVTSGSANAAINWSDGSTALTYQVQNAEILSLKGSTGNDTFTATGLLAASTIDQFSATGEAGNDTFNTGAVNSVLTGGPGTNTFNGGAGNDEVYSNSETDIIHLGGGTNRVTDRANPKFGGRQIDTTSVENSYYSAGGGTDGVFRVRPPVVPGTAIRVTSSLSRDGQQDLPTGIRYIYLGLSDNSTAPDDRGIADIVLPPGNLLFTPFGDVDDNDLLDVTVPGPYTTSGTPGATYSIAITGGGYAGIQSENFGPVSIHVPWANQNRGFVHRVTRDLMFRFATSAQLNAGQAAVEGGTTTRPQTIAGLMGTDEYRGLDVDRVFTKYLRRESDPSGRAYWISALRGGRALWRFRAQLFGSNEYFNKAGGSNEQFVRRAYADVLNREPDPSGLAFWVNRLDHGQDRGTVALQYLNSAEARRRLVDSQFLRFLDRRPTTAEQNTWVAQIPTNDGEQRLIAFLAGSGAYFTRT